MEGVGKGSLVDYRGRVVDIFTSLFCPIEVGLLLRV